MKKILVLLFIVPFSLMGCIQEKEAEITMEQSIVLHNGGMLIPDAPESESIEQQIASCLENAEERVRLLYFREDLDADLVNEQAIEIIYKEAKVFHSPIFGDISADRLIVFGSGELAADFSAPLFPIVTMDGDAIAIWHCSWK